MALRLAKELDSGFIVEYWRIIVKEISKDSNNIRFQILGYKDKTARNNGKTPIYSQETYVPYNTLPKLEWVEKEIYVYLKSLPEWQASEDV